MELQNSSIKKSSFWSNLFKDPTAKSDLENVLMSMPPFRSIGTKYIRILLKLIHNRVYTANEYVFYQGDPGIGLYIIVKGEVLITQTDIDGDRFDLVQLGKGDFFGEVALLDEEYRSASAISMKDSTLAVIFKPDLDDFIEKYPRQGVLILRGLSQMIATRLRNMNQDYFSLYNEQREKAGG